MKFVKQVLMVFIMMMSGFAMAATLSPGDKVSSDGFDVSLNKVVQPGADTIGGKGYTEYNLTLGNESGDKELVVSNIAVVVHGKTKSMVKDFDDIVAQGDTTQKSVSTNVGSAAAGYVGGLFGMVGSLASMAGVNAVAKKIYTDDPKKWHEELEQQSLPLSATGISVFPGDKATGSIWIKQPATDAAEQIRFYVKQGGKSRIVKFELNGMPEAQAAN